MAGLMRRDPFRDLMNMEREINRLFTDFGTALPVYTVRPEPDPAFVPAVDVMNRGEDLVIRAELPGLKPEDIDIAVSEDMLTIRGTRTEEHETTERDYLLRETSWGEFERTMRLPEGVKPEEVNATYHDGVLEVTVPGGAQRTMSEPVHVPIETGGAGPSQLTAHG